MRWPDLSRLGVTLNVFTGDPPLLVVSGVDMSQHGFARKGKAWVRDVLRFESSDLKSWFPGFLPGDIKEMLREQVVVTDRFFELIPDSRPTEIEKAPEGAPPRHFDHEFRLNSVGILEALIARGDIGDLYAAAGVRSADAFGDLPMDDRAAAYTAFVARNGNPVAIAEDYNTRVAREEKDAVIRRLQSDQTIALPSGAPFISEDSARHFSDEWSLGDTHAIHQTAGGFHLIRLGEANRPSVLKAMQERQAADPEYQRQEAAFARASALGDAGQAVSDAYQSGEIAIVEFELELTALEKAVDPDVAGELEPADASTSEINDGAAHPANAKEVSRPSKKKRQQEADEQEKRESQERFQREFEQRQADSRAESLQNLAARRPEIIHIPAILQAYYTTAFDSVAAQLQDERKSFVGVESFNLGGFLDAEGLFRAIASLDGVPGVKAPRDTGNDYQTAAIWTDAGELSVTHSPNGQPREHSPYQVRYSFVPQFSRDTHYDRLTTIIECDSEEQFDTRKEAGWGLSTEDASKPMPVRAIKIGDHLITFMGAAYGGRRDDGSRHQSSHGWTLVPADEYQGPTYTRKELGHLWDAETIGRGDCTGMKVRVRGKDFIFRDPVAMVFRSPAPKDYWDFKRTFPMPQRLEGVPYLFEETPEEEGQAASMAFHQDFIPQLVTHLVDIQQAKEALQTGKNPQTRRIPKTEAAQEELRVKMARIVESLPAQLAANLSEYQTHFGVTAAARLETHVRELCDDQLLSKADDEDDDSSVVNSVDDDPALEPAAISIAARQPTRIGQRVMKILTAAGVQDTILAKGEDFELTIERPPYQALCIECHPLPNAAGQGIYLTRYATQAGDTIIDSETVFRVDQDGQLIVHETGTHSPSIGGEVRGRDTKFADAMVKALIDQGFVDAAGPRAPKKGKARIVDAGEKVGGARKDRYSRMTVDVLGELNDREKLLYVTRDAIWPSINIEEAKEKGVPLSLLIMGREVRKRIALGITEPSIAESYIRIVSLLRDAYEGATSTAEFCTAIEQAAIYGGLIIEEEKPAFGYSGKMVKHKSTTEMWRDFQGAGWDYRKLNLIFWNSHVLAVKARNAASWADDHPDYDGYAALSGSRRRSPTVRDDDDKLPSRPHLAQIDRKGLPDERAGADITAEDLMARFGFRAVEFGNWLPQDERQDVLNKAYDAFCTLAMVTGFPDKMMSLEGTLAAAFGSRGKGKASAHYEPARKVFNLTRMSGAGSLAHEYFHALDDWMASKMREFLGSKGVPETTLPKSALFATEFAIERTAGRRRRPARTRATNRQMHVYYPAAFADVSPWFEMAASFLSRRETVDEVVKKHLAAEETWIKSLQRWIAYGIQRSGVSAEDAARHASEATNPFDFDKLARLRDRLYLMDADGGRLPSAQVDANMIRGHAEMSQHMNTIRSIKEFLLRLQAEPDNVDLASVTTGYFNSALQLDKKTPSKPYYSLPIELGARAFECFVFDQILKRDARDDYLVHGVEESRFGEGYRGNPYPAGIDRETINSRMSVCLKKVADKFVSSYTYESTGDLFASAPRMAACR